MKRRSDTFLAAKAAFPYTLPLLAGFLFLSIAYSILMRSMGFAPWYPIVMSIFIFAGAMQFVALNLLTAAFAPIGVLVLTLMVNARHIFYGLSMLDVYRNTGKKKWYLIFALCDETFSINCTVPVPEEIDRGKFYFFVTLFNYSYWQVGTILGALFGQFFTFDTQGIEFMMTALFLVIFVNQLMREKNHISSCMGLVISILCLIFFGKDQFILASMAGLLLLLTLMRRPIEREEAYP